MGGFVRSWLRERWKEEDGRVQDRSWEGMSGRDCILVFAELIAALACTINNIEF